MIMNKDKLIQEAVHSSLSFQTRRHFLSECRTGMGMIALGSLLEGCNFFSSNDYSISGNDHPLSAKASPFYGKAKSVIFLHMAGAPSQLEMFDYKPDLYKLDGEDCPESFIQGKKFAFIRGVPKIGRAHV